MGKLQRDCFGYLFELLLSVVQASEHAEVVLSKENFNWFGLVDEIEATHLFFFANQPKLPYAFTAARDPES